MKNSTYRSSGVCAQERKKCSGDDAGRREDKKSVSGIENISDEKQTNLDRPQTIGEKIYTYLLSN